MEWVRFGMFHSNLIIQRLISASLSPTAPSAPSSSHFANEALISPVPTSVRVTLSSPSLASQFIHETIVSLREVISAGGVAPVADMLVHVSKDCSQFTASLLEEIMKQYNNVNSGELKNLSNVTLINL